MLLSAGEPLPTTIYVHEFLTVDGQKVSKSLGNVINPVALADAYGTDALRYWLLRGMPRTEAGDFTIERLMRRYNDELANDLGNLVNRVLTMIGSYRGGLVPAPGARPRDAEAALVADHAAAVEGLAAFDRLEFKRGLEAVWVLVRGLNRYVEARAPWALNKSGAAAELDTVLATCADVLRVIAILLCPVMPDAAAALWAKLGLPQALADQRYPADVALGAMPAGVRVDRGALLFPRLLADT